MTTIFRYRSTENFRIPVSMIFSLVVLLSGCIEPYDPPATSDAVDLLVVDGFLNTADGSVSVSFTHSKPLDSESPTQPETNASMSIRTESGNEFDLFELEAGKYIAEGLPLAPMEKYQLSIRTSNGQEFQSDYVSIRPTPVIDSIVWGADEDGLNIYVNAHDATASTRYYRWDYVETWEYNAAVSSDFKVENNVPVYRNADERIYTCWRTLPSTKISIASTVRLSEDVISNYLLTTVPKGNKKISVKYSILVKQRAISKDEFTFLEQLQKTTESVGGLFDPQPSQVPGNIHNLSNPASVVLGYFSAGDTKEQRLFVDFYELPDPLQQFPINPNCQPDTICVVPSIPRAFQCTQDLQDLDGTEIIGSALLSGPSVIGYTKSIYECADCRSQGGSLTKPEFWP